jgi:hypothetical protein
MEKMITRHFIWVRRLSRRWIGPVAYLRKINGIRCLVGLLLGKRSHGCVSVDWKVILRRILTAFLRHLLKGGPLPRL